MTEASLQSRKICFVEVEPEAQGAFRDPLAGEDVIFTDTLAGVPTDTGILSVFISEWVDEAFLAAHPQLSLICTRTSGYDHIDVEGCRRHGVALTNVSSYGENTVAEHTFALILALTRRLPESAAAVRTGHFSRLGLEGIELRGRTLGVVGTGRVGVNVIRIAEAFGMKVLACDPQPNLSLSELLKFTYVGLEELLRESEILTLHLPLTAETRHMINRDSLAKCRPGMFIINTARGGLMDTAAVVEALDSGQLSGIGLDVLEDERVFQEGGATSLLTEQIAERVHNASALAAREPSRARLAEFARLVTHTRLLDRDDVVLTPHVAYNSVEAKACMRDSVMANIRAHLAGQPLQHLCP